MPERLDDDRTPGTVLMGRPEFARKKDAQNRAMLPAAISALGELLVKVQSGVTLAVSAITSLPNLVISTMPAVESALGCQRLGAAVAATTATTVFTATARARDCFLRLAPLLAEDVVALVWVRPLGATATDAMCVGRVSIASGEGPFDLDLGGLANTDKVDVQVVTGTTNKLACTTYGELY